MRRLLLTSVVAGSYVFAQTPQYIWQLTPQGTNREDFQDVVYYDGHIYAIGAFNDSVIFSSSTVLRTQGGYDVMVVKIDTNGNLKWAKSLGGPFTDAGLSLFVSGGRIYMTGRVTGTVDFDPGPGTFTLDGYGNRDGFLAVWDTAGNFINAVRWGSDQYDEAYSVTVVGDTLVVVSLNVEDTIDLNPAPGPTDSVPYISVGGSDICLIALDSSLTYRWSRCTGSDGRDKIYALASDNAGNIYATGYTNDTIDLSFGAGTAIHATSTTQADIIVLSLDKTGTFRFGFGLGAGASDYGYDIHVSGTKVLLTGIFQSTVDFDPSSGTYTLSSNGSADAFLAIYSTNGSLTWAGNFGSPSYDYGSAVTSYNQYVYVAGRFQDVADMDPSPGVDYIYSAGDYDIYLAKFDTLGNYYWAREAGSTNQDRGYGVAVFGISAYIVGTYNTGNARLGPRHSGPLAIPDTLYDPFIVKWAENCVSITAPTQTVSACTQFTLPSGTVVTTSGLYYDTLVTFTGCDSIVPFDVTINPPLYDTITVSACDSITLPSGVVATSSGYYPFDTLVAISTGCDSIIIADVTINLTKRDTVPHEACSYFVNAFGDTFTVSGIYVFDSLTTSKGCDSIVYYDVSITTIDTNVSVSNNVLTATAGADAYQWIDCSTNSPIAGATSNTFVADQSGSYAVVITVGSCTDTSGCHNVTVSGLEFPEATDVVIISYTADNKIRIKPLNPADIEIFDSFGRKIYSARRAIEVLLSDLPAGIYFMFINGSGQPVKIKAWGGK